MLVCRMCCFMFQNVILCYLSTCRRSFRYSPLLSGSAMTRSRSSQLRWKAVIRGSDELKAMRLGLASALYSEILVEDSLSGSPSVGITKNEERVEEALLIAGLSESYL